jgi:hypothetical protein
MAKKMTPTTRPGRNGGTLRSGNPGNRGGSGTVPSILRDQLRGSFASRIATLEQIADGEVVAKMKVAEKETEMMVSADVSDRLKAIDMLGKYGLGTVKEISVEAVREKVKETLRIIGEHTSPEQRVVIFRELQPVWTSAGA